MKEIVSKAVFEIMLGKLFAVLVVRGFLAVGGTALVPVVGTAVGLGAGVGVDFLFLKTDELMNRASNREEIIGAIEENRKEMLEAVSS